MRAATAFTLFSTALLGRAAVHNAEIAKGNPVGVVYKATLPEEPFFKDTSIEGNVKGYISAEATKPGDGVTFKVRFENLPKEGGPFLYHIHVDPAEGGNCTKTLAHLDPFGRGEDPPCNKSDPASCQVGDLSGKFGSISTDPFEAKYTDYYASAKKGVGSFFGNRSFVLHYANKTRLTCADFKLAGNTTWTVPALTAPFTKSPIATAAPTAPVAPAQTKTYTTPGAPSSTETPITSGTGKLLSAPLVLSGIAALIGFM